MSKTIIGDFFTIRDEDLEETTEYLSQLGMTFNGGIENCLFSIELRELPEIMWKLEQSGYFDFQGGAKEWEILKISSRDVPVERLYQSSFVLSDVSAAIPQRKFRN
ncbi:MAG: hypothetical protein LDL41_08685 [Coleofasciculus sp. S288]|nr:hypothetical protein [Coleofasciculus sp. S288]